MIDSMPNGMQAGRDERTPGRLAVAGQARDPSVLSQEAFPRALCLERKRTERSRRPFVLMLLDCARLVKTGRGPRVLPQVLRSLCASTRETDTIGWYREPSVIGVIFTEIGSTDSKPVVNALLAKVTNALAASLTVDEINEVNLSFHVFPDDLDKRGADDPTDEILYPDLRRNPGDGAGSQAVKRALDLFGSLAALALLSPFFLLIALAVKLTSRGPVLFRQERLGRYRKRFTCLKFRSMYTGSDPAIHEAYVKWLISGTDPPPSRGPVFKLTGDPRITPVGRFLRKTSLDELPQFLNVLHGSMSLVGPRPPIPYEYRAYDLWHQRRLLAVKPGITGLWQVSGRSKLKFDEMVRLDLKYCNSWSLWLDLKILFRTPWVVLTGEGAY